jgi:hypothetical protein
MQKVMTPSPARGKGAGVGHLQEVEEVEGPRLPPQEDDPDEEAHVRGLGDPEGLDGGPSRLRARVPVADEEVGAETHQLPADEELGEVRGEHQSHHREGERATGTCSSGRGRPALSSER